jgi:AcrR family transcriptional regulator
MIERRGASLAKRKTSKPSPKKPGRREQGKFERRRRVTEAAREVIRKRGYDNATTREIAAHAGVAIGTLFIYAPEKRDLLFMVMNDDLDAMIETGAARLSLERPFMEQLLELLRPLYRYFSKNVAIGRHGLREIFLFQDEQHEKLGPEAHRVFMRIERTRESIARLVDELKAEGRLTTKEKGYLIARTLQWIHWGHIQAWLAEGKPKADEGIRRLEQLLALVIRGLGPGPREI